MNEQADYQLTDQTKKDDFANYINVPTWVIDAVENLTDLGHLGVQQKNELTANKQQGYVYRSYHRETVGAGLFNLCCRRFYLAFLEEYSMSPKIISETLQKNKISYVAIDTPIDDGYWLYIDLTMYVFNPCKLQTEMKRIIDLVQKTKQEQAESVKPQKNNAKK